MIGLLKIMKNGEFPLDFTDGGFGKDGKEGLLI
jgi:hypothetical protein